jgi:hypothetical protein
VHGLVIKTSLKIVLVDSYINIHHHKKNKQGVYMYIGKIPYKRFIGPCNNCACSHQYGCQYETCYRDNSIWEDKLKLISYNKIRSGIALKFESLIDRSRYEMTFGNFFPLLAAGALKDNILSGKFTFYKSGQSYYIEMVGRTSENTTIRSEKILEDFIGYIDRVDGDIAYITLRSKHNDDILYGEYSAIELAKKNIYEQDQFSCKTIEEEIREIKEEIDRQFPEMGKDIIY